ncbi:hypothetical protein [Fuchsiella alkaliacetigena]|uniref:hypothetical protein n=1 Tax=Fuchsiella alkaliacetigena TaxID=957042 RepID=UPI00200A9E8F|nr:hypothetical protein [Fuchsiella alkaliacetigena]MCK8825644.1 hypothetical protein [Fuchsiella alkaliacetigena]
MAKLKEGDILEGIVLEVKEEKNSAVINFGNYALEARILSAQLEVGEEVRVQIKGKYKNTIVLKVLNSEGKLDNGSIDFKA